ncbi:ATP-dependent DNA ligase, partial [Aquincola tertiaricarbonis]|uniref:ATP-dependent DNA ligase n=1 Tax=Aquincola tertiaricarbonis TaxID=391953 RepID=UPI000A956940
LLGVGTPFSDPDWLYEIKYDGYRMLAEWDGGTVRLQSRNGTDATRWFPEVVASLACLRGGRCIVDGEVCVLDDLGRSDFNKLHARAKRRGYRAGDDVTVFCVFDLLVQDGKSMMQLPLVERKKRLAKVLAGEMPCVLPVGHFDEVGQDLYRQAVQLKLEGIVAKRMASPYVPGARSSDWLKIKRPGGTPAERFKRSVLE